MSLKILVLLLIAVMTGVGAVDVEGKSSTDDPFVLKIHKEFVDYDHWIDQFLFRSFYISYGHRNLVAKANRLKSLLVTPPYGRFRDHCLAFEMLRKDLFYLGSLMPDYAFLYFSTLGRTLQGSSNPDGTPKPYVKFFDDVSLRMGCQGYQADELMLNLYDYYNDALAEFRRLDIHHKINDEMQKMQQHLNHVNTEPDVVFNATSCEKATLEGYIIEFRDDDHWINQALFRTFIDSYGHKDLVTKSNRLKSLLESPPYGKYRDHCVAITMLRRDLFFYGSIVPEYMFVYLGTLGRTLQRSSNLDGSPKPYIKYFDEVSLRLGCQGYEADELLLNMADYFDDAATDYGTLANTYKVNDEMVMMQQRLKHVNTEPDVVFNARNCNIPNLEDYIMEKLQEIQAEYERLALDATDKDIGDVFKKYRDLSPVATTFYLCIGSRNELAEEVNADVIYEMRKVLHLMMAKEQEKEKQILSTIHEGGFQLDRRQHRRYTVTTVPKNSVLSCFGKNETLSEDKKFVLRHCFSRCQELVEEERRMMKEGCKNDDGSPTECQFCQVSVPKEENDRFWATSFTNVKVDKGDFTMYHFPSHNYSSMVPPLLTKKDVQKLLSYNIDYVRPPPPDYHFHQEPMGKFRFPYEEPEQIDWMPYVWLSLKTAIVTTVVIWLIYGYNVFRFRLIRWFNRRWEQLYRRLVGM